MSGCDCSTTGRTNGLRGCHPLLVAWPLPLIADWACVTKRVCVCEQRKRCMHIHVLYFHIYARVHTYKSFYESTVRFNAFAAHKWSCVGLEPKLSASVFIIFYRPSYLLSSALLVKLTNIHTNTISTCHSANYFIVVASLKARKVF